MEEHKLAKVTRIRETKASHFESAAKITRGTRVVKRKKDTKCFSVKCTLTMLTEKSLATCLFSMNDDRCCKLSSFVIIKHPGISSSTEAEKCNQVVKPSQGND